MPKKQLKQMVLELIESNLRKYFNTSFNAATNEQLFKAIASVTIDEMFEIRGLKKKPDSPKAAGKKPVKTLHYLTIEILLGRSLEATLFNLGWDKIFADAFKQKGLDINKIYSVETDAGLGNGGLGRLAACFMDSLATLNYPATAHCIKYDFGLFKQRIIDGQQVEFLDDWLVNGSIWLAARPDEAVTVRFGGNVYPRRGTDGKLKFVYEGSQEVVAVPYDMMLSGYHSQIVSGLKLWSAKNKLPGDVYLSRGELAHNIKESQEIESINSVLYPSMEQGYGQTLRLKQQYFLCSASMQSIINAHLRKGFDLKQLAQHVAIHINDTHPVMAIPELMRILMDDHSFSWDEAWDIVTKCISYTNHTVLSEALEVWESELLAIRIPRIYQIICEIDRRFREFVSRAKKNSGSVEEIAIISHNRIHMANLAVCACSKINGVSKIHTEILQSKLFKGFYDLYPEKFINITNGVAHRRWMIQNNPLLADLIKTLIGTKFHTDASCMQTLNKWLEDENVLKKINQIKLANKKQFAKWLYQNQGIEINPESRFDVHVKRFHEYKRQLLNVLRIIHLYNILKSNPHADITPQTFIFSGKAASSYYIAKRIIKLINQVAAEIDKNDEINKIIKIVFVENFSVTISERLMPATDVSQQISLSGQEASGTGNMKAVMNGALMMCTFDGANAEIIEHCGEETSFVFGLTPSDVARVWRDSYNSIDVYNSSPKIMAVIDALNTGFNGESFKDISSYLLGTAHNNDNYMCLVDFESYIAAHEKMDALYRKPLEWARATLQNISQMGYFSSERSIIEYVNNIWGLTKLKPAAVAPEK